MPPTFYSVLGNRDHLKVRQADGAFVKEPIWKYIPGQWYWLTSLVYLKGVQRPPDSSFILDCGAWSYKGEAAPRWTPGQCLEQYATFTRPGDMVAAPDHMVLRGMSAEEERYRIDLTLDNAREFLRLCPPDWRPLAVTHGNTVPERTAMLEELLGMGYRHIAIGSVAIRAGNRKFIRAVLEEVARLRQQGRFYVHVLGVSALSWYGEFSDYGVDSFDGSSMFFSAFTAAEYLWWDGERLAEFTVKGVSDPQGIPLCECPACVAMRAQGVDTRLMGSNEHNMGRAVHNINQYRNGLASAQDRTRQTRLGL